MQKLIVAAGLVWAFHLNAQPLIWPIPEALHDRTYISNYVDLFPGSGNGFGDYECGNEHGYDGHLGLDIAADDFRVSDQGVPVIASADGVVDSVTDHQFDRNLWPPYQGSGNGVWLRHDDGRYSLYWHLRQNSIPVAVGERVSAGQLLGYVASSGSSPIPHLHFQYNASRQLNDRLPLFTGRCGAADTAVFVDQPDYVGDTGLRVLALGLHRQRSLDGVYQSGAIPEIKQGLAEPYVYGIGEPSVSIFLQFQGNSGQQIRLLLVDPDGVVQDEFRYRIQIKRRYGWLIHHFPNRDTLRAGPWQVRVLDDDELLATHKFAVAEETLMPPRFYPLAGRSIRLDGTGQSFQLTRSDQQSVELILRGAPEGVSLSGETVMVDGSTRPSRRHSQFAVVARDTESGLQDVYHLQVVNPQASNAVAFFDQSTTGFYYLPQSAGQGLALEVDEALQQIFLAWFTFDAPTTQAAPVPWLTAQGSYQGAFANLDVTLTSGGDFDRTTPVVNSEAGSIGRVRLQRESCNRINLTYEWRAGREGFIPLQRLFPSQCAD